MTTKEEVKKEFSDYPSNATFDLGSSDIRAQLKIMIWSVHDDYCKSKNMSRKEIFEYFLNGIESLLNKVENDAKEDKSNFIVCPYCEGKGWVTGMEQTGEDEYDQVQDHCFKCQDTGIMTIKEYERFIKEREDNNKLQVDTENIDPNDLPF